MLGTTTEFLVNQHTSNACWELQFSCLIIEPSRGVPNLLALRNNRVAQVQRDLVPNTDTAVSMYEATGGRLGRITGFGVDPLAGEEELIEERCILMETNMPSPDDLFGFTVNNLYQPFSDSLEYMVDITQDLQRRYL